MTAEYELKLYEIKWKWHTLAFLALFLTIIVFRSQEIIMQLPGPAQTSLIAILLFNLLCRSSLFTANRIQDYFKIKFPSVKLWLYPMIVLLALGIFSYSFLAFSNFLWGRGFLSNWLQLTGQETTSFFSTCFLSMLLFTGLHFILSTFSVLLWIRNNSSARINKLHQMKSSESPQIAHRDFIATIDKLQAKTEFLRKERLKATKFNRISLLIIFLALLAGICQIIFFHPAIVLYYRAVIQLRTFVEPLAAYKTLEHLSEKYPDYRFMDSVKYRMAWILDRRLNQYSQAAESYRNFLKKFSVSSIWSDEAIAALVRLCVDKLNLPDEGLKWCKKYLEIFPDRIMAPHMYLYKIRVYEALNDHQAAKHESEIAKKLFSGKTMQILNSEDRVIEIIDFSEALATNASFNSKR